MSTTFENIEWRLPWRPLNHASDIPGLQRQLERELASGHPLWGRNAEVVGRRVDNDDVLVRCRDGKLATVHLDWGTGPHAYPSEYPSIVHHESLTAFQQVLDGDSKDYGDEE